MKYLGCIKQKEFEGFSPQQQSEFLVSKGIWMLMNRMTLKKNHGIDKIDSELTQLPVPKTDVANEFYQFIVARYESSIFTPFYNFSLGFNEDRYGLKKSKQKQLALRHFKDYFETLANKSIAIGFDVKLENGGTYLEPMNKLQIIYAQQNALKSELSKTKLLNQFLFGNTAFFTLALIEDFKLLEEIIYFEGILKILVSLNDQYHFEKTGVLTSTTPKKTQKKTQNTLSKTVKNTPNPSKKPIEYPVLEEKQPIKKRVPLISDEEAIEYLIATVFTKK